MAKNDIGGFFVSLGLKADKDSFEKGSKLVDSVATSMNKLIGTAKNTAVVLAGTAVATSVVESANYKTAKAMGITTEALDLWKASAKIAGVSADGLVGSMGKLANVMNHMTVDGSGLEAYSEQLGKLGLGFSELENLEDPAAAYEKIIATAQERAAEAQKKIADAKKALELNPEDAEAQNKLTEGKKEEQRIITIVGDILGSEGQNFFIELERQGKNISDFLAQAQKTVFTDSENAQKGADFAVELNTFKTTVESMGKLVGDEVAGLLTEPLKSVNNWLQNNGDTIKNTVEKISKTTIDTIGKGVNYVHEWWQAHGDETTRIIGDIKEKAVDVIGEGIKSMSEWWDANGDTIKDLVNNSYDILKSIYEKVKPIAEKLVGDTVKMTDAIIKLVKGDSEGALEAFQKTNLYKDFKTTGDIDKAVNSFRKENGYKWYQFVNFSDLPEEIQLALLSYYQRGGNKTWTPSGVDVKSTQEARISAGIQDGIMRPDGTITQVAPDDWVFAVRNISDLAQSFGGANQEEKNVLQNTATKPEKIRIDVHQDPGIAQPARIVEKETQNDIARPTKIIEKEIHDDIARPAKIIEKEIHDGIVRPDGTVTQVAPDDWVFAVRNLRDLARAFIPQTAGTNIQAPSEYVINQTFNINGSSDIPQVLKAQAYKGTQEGLMAIMEQSSRRLELMSGTR